VVHAPRQTGKTTTLATLARTLTAEGRYLAVRFSCEAGEVAGDDYAAAEEQVRYAIRRAAVAFALPDQLHPPDPWPDAPARAAQGAWPARVRTRTASPHDMGLPSGGVPPRGRTAVPAGTWRRRAPAPPRGLHTQSVCYAAAMGAKTIGFAISDEDRPTLDELVEYFGNGNRSAYLRETLKIMTSVKLAEEWQQLQAYGQSRLDALGLTIDEVPALVRQELKGR
jgi:hypothetical protein